MSGAPLENSFPFGRAAAKSAHLLQLYREDSFLVKRVASFLAEGLSSGEPAVVIGTPDHRMEIESDLSARQLDVNKLKARGLLILIDASETLDNFMVGNMPDLRRFSSTIDRLMIRALAQSGASRMRAFGEMVALLWSREEREAAVRLEEFWMAFVDRNPVMLLCAYSMGTFANDVDGTLFSQVCAAHHDVLPTESYSALTTDAERMRSVVQLQHKARLLESEIAKRSKLETELKARLAQLAESDRRKNEFLSMLGHELRNPLAAVRNSLVTAGLDSQRRGHAMEIARRQTDHLTRLVDDLLDIARITEGRITLRKERIGAASILERAIESSRALTEPRQHRMTVSIEPAAAIARIDCDPARLQQMLNNLIHNAAKFTNPGGQIDISATRDGSDLLIRVRDCGVGIAPDRLPFIFDLFTQGDISIDRKQGGLGIGLSVVKQLVEMHGGTVCAISKDPDKGSEFQVRLPISEGNGDLSNPKLSSVPAAKGWRVLVVEDNADVAESMALLLQVLGHEAETTDNGHSAIERIRDGNYDIALIDIGLHGIDGYEVARKIRAMNIGRQPFLAAVTGYGQAEDKARASAAGFDRHLMKPVSIETLEQLFSR